MNDLFSPDTIRLVLLIIFGAFLLFYLLYGFFALYHAIKYGFSQDKLTYPALILFVAGSVGLIFGTLFLMNIF